MAAFSGGAEVASFAGSCCELFGQRHCLFDETIKRRLYERFGVSEYWIIDPELDAIKVYRTTDGRFERVAELSLERDDVLESPLFPNLALPLVDIFDE